MFSPDFSKHLDINPVNKEWLIRDSFSGDPYYRIQTSLLSYDPKAQNEVFEQTRFIAWENNSTIKLIDVNADPPILEVMEIPDLSKEERESGDTKFTREKASGSIPYLDKEPYSVSYKNEEKKQREIGIYNFFKGNLKLDLDDTKSRLMRRHNILKYAWYLHEDEKERLETMVQDGDPNRFSQIY